MTAGAPNELLVDDKADWIFDCLPVETHRLLFKTTGRSLWERKKASVLESPYAVSSPLLSLEQLIRLWPAAVLSDFPKFSILANLQESKTRTIDLFGDASAKSFGSIVLPLSHRTFLSHFSPPPT